MPNHFHLMVLVNYTMLPISTEGFALSEAFGQQSAKQRTINNSIGLMLRSYTNAINKQQNRSGALFRRKTKAICLNHPDGISPLWFTDNGITRINLQNPEKQYPQICFNYIHQNPAKAKLVKTNTDWEYSSAKDYADLRNGKLVNKELASKYLKTS